MKEEFTWPSGGVSFSPHTPCPFLMPVFLHVGVCPQGAGWWGVTLCLSSHGTGLEVLELHNSTSGPRQWECPWAPNSVSNQKNEGERNAIKRKEVLPSQAGWRVNKLCL